MVWGSFTLSWFEVRKNLKLVLISPSQVQVLDALLFTLLILRIQSSYVCFTGLE